MAKRNLHASWTPPPPPQLRAPLREAGAAAPLRLCLLAGVAALSLLSPKLALADPVGTAGAANVLSSGTPPGGNMKVI